MHSGAWVERKGTVEVSDLSQPHWVWFVIALVIPVALLFVAMLGLGRGSFIAFGVALACPIVALLIALGTLAIALTRRRVIPIRIASAGVMLTALGCAWLYWLGSAR